MASLELFDSKIIHHHDCNMFLWVYKLYNKGRFLFYLFIFLALSANGFVCDKPTEQH